MNDLWLLARRVAARWRRTRARQDSPDRAVRPGAASRLSGWWRRRGRLQRTSLIAGAALLAAAVTLGVLAWTGISAALDARRAYRELQVEMSHLTPLDLVQITVYDSLEGRFKEAEDASAKARSRLAFLRAFKWLPGLGGRIDEAHILLEMGFYQGRAGRNLAAAYRAAIALPLEDLPAAEAAEEVSRALQEAAPQLIQVQEDLRRVAELRKRLGSTERGARYGVLIDRYLPALQTVAYLSRTSPGVIGHTYALSRELSLLRELAADPLDVIASPEGIGEILENIAEQATSLEAEFEVVRKATSIRGADDAEELDAVRDVLDTLGPGVTLLRHVTAGTRSLVAMADAVESKGFLSRDFGTAAGAALDEALRELSLARQETDSLQRLLSVQGIDVETFLPSVGFGADSDVSISTTERVELLLDEALRVTKFLRSFLGYERPMTYLLLGQNQKEIRATGGSSGSPCGPP